MSGVTATAENVEMREAWQGMTKPQRDASILQQRAAGKTYEDIATHEGCGIGTAYRVCEAHADKLALLKERAERKILEADNSFVDTAIAVGSDIDHKNNHHAWKWLGELLGWTGFKGAQVHIGDVNHTMLQVNVATGAPLQRDDALEADLRASLGMGGDAAAVVVGDAPQAVEHTVVDADVPLGGDE